MWRQERYKVGDVLCDMHDGFKYLPDNLTPGDDNYIKVRLDGSSELLRRLCNNKMVTNKYLVVVALTEVGYLAAWSYDDRYFGLVELTHVRV